MVRFNPNPNVTEIARVADVHSGTARILTHCLPDWLNTHCSLKPWRNKGPVSLRSKIDLICKSILVVK